MVVPPAFNRSNSRRISRVDDDARKPVTIERNGQRQADQAAAQDYDIGLFH